MHFHATTILSVRRAGLVALGGDGQVTLDKTIIKSDASKVRSLAGGKVIVGFAGGVADAFALMERFEAKLKDYPANLPRAATELAKEWRSDRALRRLEALLIAVDAKSSLLVSGTGDRRNRATGADNRWRTRHLFRRGAGGRATANGMTYGRYGTNNHAFRFATSANAARDRG